MVPRTEVFSRLGYKHVQRVVTDERKMSPRAIGTNEKGL